MGTKILSVASAIALICLTLNSCDTPVGQGAAWGAATGAIIGGAAAGNVRAASNCAAAGGAPGAFTSKNCPGKQSPAFGPPPPRGVSFAPWGGRPGGFFWPLT